MKFEKKTNFDKLKEMTADEIVAWLGGNDERLCSFSCPPAETVCNDDCRQCWLDWLNKEVEE